MTCSTFELFNVRVFFFVRLGQKYILIRFFSTGLFQIKKKLALTLMETCVVQIRNLSFNNAYGSLSWLWFETGTINWIPYLYLRYCRSSFIFTQWRHFWQHIVVLIFKVRYIPCNYLCCQCAAKFWYQTRDYS